MPWNPADPQFRPVVVIVRHPDRENDIRVYAGNGEPLVIDLDLGGSFDITHPEDDGFEEEATDWIESHEADIEKLPADHPAREDILGVIEEVREEMDNA